MNIMAKKRSMSSQTRINWLIDVAVFFSAVVAILSGIYFLFYTSGGYQGGRNTSYGVEVLFGRHTWNDLHTWGGVLMIAAVVVHFVYHWPWVVGMGRRIFIRMWSKGSRVSKGAVINVTIDAVMAGAFLITALSGIYFLFAPTGGYSGGANPGWDPGFLFSRTTWDLIHTWAGVLMITAAVIHFIIHWRWVAKVTIRFFGSLEAPFSARRVVTS